MFKQVSKILVMGLMIALFLPSYAVMGMENEEVVCLTESQKCSWASLGVTTLIGVATGVVGGVVADVAFNVLCNHMPLAKTDDYWRPIRN
jgi:hypothetical protein